MNIAIIFAGGTGQRMNTLTKPKQFLELHNKPILVYTLEHFQNHPQIDAIIVVMLSDWIPRCEALVDYYHLTKVKAIVPGGSTGQASICNGVRKAAELFPEDSVLLIHDGVRPLIDEKTITAAIDCVEKHGSAVTVSLAIETVTIKNDSGIIDQIIDRSKCQLAKAPQCFYLKDILSAHEQALHDGKTDFIDSASLMRYYGHEIFTVEGSPENIKITTPMDFYLFRAILDAKENSQIFGF